MRKSIGITTRVYFNKYTIGESVQRVSVLIHSCLEMKSAMGGENR